MYEDAKLLQIHLLRFVNQTFTWTVQLLEHIFDKSIPVELN